MVHLQKPCQRAIADHMIFWNRLTGGDRAGSSISSVTRKKAMKLLPIGLSLALLLSSGGCKSRSKAPNAPGAWYKDERIEGGKKEGSFDGAQEKILPGSRH